MSTRPPALVLVNPAAHGGAAEKRYCTVARAVETRFDVARIHTDLAGRWRHAVGDALRSGVRVFLAAGGDGTVGALVGALCDVRGEVPLDEIAIGAIGLGSSNDFHKPFRNLVAGIPLRIDVERAAPRDLVGVRYRDADGRERKRVFVVSASVGATATANARFSENRGLARILRRRWTAAAIVFAALRAIAGHRNVSTDLRPRGEGHRVRLSNLSILKTPYLSGSFAFDTPVAPASGLLAVNLCEDMGRLGLVAALARLARGQFLGRPGTRHWTTDTVTVETEHPVDLELDGELVRASWARFEVLPERIRACA